MFCVGDGAGGGWMTHRRTNHRAKRDVLVEMSDGEIETQETPGGFDLGQGPIFGHHFEGLSAL